MCDKISYETIEEARQEAHGIGRAGRGQMVPYKCTICGKYHLTSVKHKPRLKRNNNKYPFRYHPQKKKK